MESISPKKFVEDLIHEMWNNENYLESKSRAVKSANLNAPLLSSLAVALDKRCSGSLGTRSSRKQLQALVHLASGNEVMPVNSASRIPSTCTLCVCAFIGKGKPVYFKRLKRLLAAS